MCFVEQSGKAYVTNPLAPELIAPCTKHKTGDLNGCPLLCMFLDGDFGWCLVFSPWYCMSKFSLSTKG